MKEDTDLIEDIDIDDLLDEAKVVLDEAKKKVKEGDCEDADESDESDEEEDLEEGKKKMNPWKKAKMKKESDEDSDDDSEKDDEEMDEAFGKKDDDSDDDADGKDDDNDGEADDDDDEPDDDDSKGEDKDKPKPAFLKKIKKESIDFSEDLDKLVAEDTSLSEDFKEKAGTLFEVALTTRLREETERLQEDFDDRLIEETTKIRESLEEKVDNYLTYAVESWVEDNKIAIEHGLRTEVAESFISALKNVFVEHYIEVPDAKKDVVAELETKLTEAEEALSVKGKEAETLAEQVEELVREKVIAEATESLADTQGARLRDLVQDIEFVSEETFRKKVNTIKECYFADNDEEDEIVEDSKSYTKTEVIVEESDDSSDHTPAMQNYLKALGRINKASNMSGSK